MDAALRWRQGGVMSMNVMIKHGVGTVGTAVVLMIRNKHAFTGWGHSTMVPSLKTTFVVIDAKEELIV